MIDPLLRHQRRIFHDPVVEGDCWSQYCTGCDWDTRDYLGTFEDHLNLICPKCGDQPGFESAPIKHDCMP